MATGGFNNGLMNHPTRFSDDMYALFRYIGTYKTKERRKMMQQRTKVWLVRKKLRRIFKGLVGQLATRVVGPDAINPTRFPDDV